MFLDLPEFFHISSVELFRSHVTVLRVLDGGVVLIEILYELGYLIRHSHQTSSGRRAM